MRKIALLIGFVAWLASVDAEAAPNSVSFTGRLSAEDEPVDGVVDVTFTFYDQPTGGSMKWTDTVELTAEQGLVYAMLGRADHPLDKTVFTGAAMYLEIVLQGETLSPRLSINSTPYAVRSSGADSADLLGALAPSDVVTRVIAGTGLTGGGSGNTLTLSVNSAVVQSRVTGTCPTGQSIQTISATGTVTCEVDDNTIYAGTNGVSVSGNTIGLATNGCAVGSIWKFNGTGFTCVPDTGFSSCTWNSATSTTAVVSQAVACPAGKHPISGGCYSPGTGATQAVVETRPASFPINNTPVTGEAGWNCYFASASAGYVAYALCCIIN